LVNLSVKTLVIWIVIESNRVRVECGLKFGSSLARPTIECASFFQNPKYA